MTRTNAHALLTVGLRVFAAYYLVTTLGSAVAGFFYAPGEYAEQQKIMRIVELATCMLFVAVWLFADKIAGFGLASRAAPAFESSIEPTMWLRIGVVLIGILAAAEALVTLVRMAAFALMLSNADMPLELDPQSRATILAAVVRLLIGLWLTLGASGFIAIVERARFAGPASRNIAPDEPPAP